MIYLTSTQESIFVNLQEMSNVLEEYSAIFEILSKLLYVEPYSKYINFENSVMVYIKTSRNIFKLLLNSIIKHFVNIYLYL